MPAGNRTFHSGLLTLYEAGGVEAFGNSIVEALAILVSGDCHSAQEIDFNALTMRGPAKYPHGYFAGMPSIEEAMRAWRTNVYQHPVPAYTLRTGAAGVYAISDFLSQHRYRKLPLYGEFYSKYPMEDQLLLTMRPQKGVVVGLAIARSTRSFKEKDRETLRCLKPHILQAYRNAMRFSQVEKVARFPLEHAAGAASKLGLTARQAEVLLAVARSSNNAKAAGILGVSPLTVKKHLENIYLMIGVQSKAQALSRLMTVVDPADQLGQATGPIRMEGIPYAFEMEAMRKRTTPRA